MNSTLIHFIVAALIALGALGVYATEFVMLTNARNEAATAFADVARIEEENRSIANAKDTIAALESDEAAIAAHFVSPTDIVPFLEGLEQEGEGLGTRVEVVSVSSPNEADGRITLSLRIEGSFAAVMRTLGSFEYSQQDMRLSSLTLDTIQGEEERVWTAATVFTIATQTP